MRNFDLCHYLNNGQSSHSQKSPRNLDAGSFYSTGELNTPSFITDAVASLKQITSKAKSKIEHFSLGCLNKASGELATYLLTAKTKLHCFFPKQRLTLHRRSMLRYMIDTLGVRVVVNFRYTSLVSMLYPRRFWPTITYRAQISTFALSEQRNSGSFRRDRILLSLCYYLKL